MTAQRPAVRRTARLALVSTVLATCAVPLAAPSAAADPRADKKQADAEVARAAATLEGATTRAQEAARRLASVTAALPGAEQRVLDARGQVVAATVAANTARRQAERARAEVAAAQADYRTAVRAVEAGRQRVADFVAASYKGGDLVSINVLMAARSPQELISRSGYVDRILTTERNAVAELAVARRAARQAENEAELKRRRAAEADARAAAALVAARVAQDRAQGAAADLRTLAAQRSSALTVARQERAASLARYHQAKREAERVAAELRAWQARQRAHGPTLRPGATLTMPVRGWKSSDFGWRFDPFFHVWQLHAGVDLAAAGGQPIHAGADGQVIRAGWNGGYGNLTCLSHGRARGRWLTTCYAHQSGISVSPGQYVRRGQVIGRVGTTGASTGNHLHFEVRLDGSPVQPLDWLPDCLC